MSFLILINYIIINMFLGCMAMIQIKYNISDHSNQSSEKKYFHNLLPASSTIYTW